MRTIGYIRVSTEEQCREGVSLDAQKAKIEAYCGLHGLDLIAIIEDAGISGKTISKRPGIQEVIARLQDGEASGLVVVKLDRLSRSTRDILDFVDRTEKNGWELHSINEKLDTGSAAGRFTVTILSALAQMESEQIGERTKAALDHKRTNGDYLGAPPYGFEAKENSAGKKALVPVPAEQKVLARIASLRDDGLTLEQIAKNLNRSRIRTKRGKKWARGTVHSVLKTAKAMGNPSR